MRFGKKYAKTSKEVALLTILVTATFLYLHVLLHVIQHYVVFR